MSDDYGTCPIDVEHVSYYDCPSCRRGIRHSEVCRRCGRLGEIWDRIDYIQAQLRLRLLRYDRPASVGWLSKWATIWVSAAHKLEARMLEEVDP